MLAQGFLDLFFDAAPLLEYFFQFFELSTKAAFAKAAFDTLRGNCRKCGHQNVEDAENAAEWLYCDWL